MDLKPYMPWGCYPKLTIPFDVIVVLIDNWLFFFTLYTLVASKGHFPIPVHIYFFHLNFIFNHNMF